MAEAQVLPKELRLTAPPTMPQARSYLFKQAMTDQTVEFGNTITINLPRLQRSYLTKDSYLRFDLVLEYTGCDDEYPSNGGIMCWDTPGAFGLIDKIEVFDYLGSTLLESTSGHGQLMALLMDLGTAKSSMANHYNTIAGTTAGTNSRWRNGIAEPSLLTSTETGTAQISINDTVPTKNSGPAAADSSFAYTYDNARVNTNDPPNSGEALFVKSDTTTNKHQVYRQYALPLFSFLGLLSQKYAPLHNGYTIVITTNSTNVALGGVQHYKSTLSNVASGTHFGNGTLADFTTSEDFALGAITPTTAYVQNVYFCAQVLELGPVAESMLLESTQGAPLVVPTKAYRNYVGQVDAKSSSYRLDLNLNVASLTNILWMMRPSTHVNDIRCRSLSNRIRNFLQNWYFQYGSSVLPQTSGINAMAPKGTVAAGAGFTEAYAELLKARHGWNKEEHATLINAENFTIDESIFCNDCHILVNDPHSITPYNQIDANTRMPLAAAGRGPYCPYLTPFNTSPVGKFACGLDLELVSGKTNDVICGMNTNGMNTSIYANFHPDYITYTSGNEYEPHVRAARVDAWAEYDAFINVSPSIATTVSF